MDGSQAIAAGALSALSLDAQHDRLMRLEFPFDDGPDRISYRTDSRRTRKSRDAFASRSNSYRTTRAFP